jgi:hypothetical protein
VAAQLSRLDQGSEALADHEADELLDVQAALVGDHRVGVDVDGQGSAHGRGQLKAEVHRQPDLPQEPLAEGADARADLAPVGHAPT